jgi:hypothetical protein
LTCYNWINWDKCWIQGFIDRTRVKGETRITSARDNVIAASVDEEVTYIERWLRFRGHFDEPSLVGVITSLFPKH